LHSLKQLITNAIDGIKEKGKWWMTITTSQ
jgi:hypothetical protein